VPHNVNDADMHPGMTSAVQDREGPTEMILVSVMYKFVMLRLRTPELQPEKMLTHLSALKNNIGQTVDNERANYHRELFRDFIAEIKQLRDTRCVSELLALRSTR
jgi:uncharacterized protein (DUF362 family)